MAKVQIPEEEPLFTLPLKHYRVKPEGPQFKVGDWICQDTTYVMKVNRITDYAYHSNDGKAIKLENAKLWKPKPGEWCWYSKWDKIVCVEFYLCKFVLDMNEVEPEFKHKYEPFIGELPTFLKDNT